VSRTGSIVLVSLAILAGPVAAQDGPWALTNARIHTVTRGVIERGTIVIRDGLIAAVGPDVAAPADARVLDLTGRTVFPAFIDLTSSLGLPSTPAAPAGRPGAAAGAASEPANVGLEPDRVVADELRPSASDVQSARDAGFGAVLSAPSRGAFRGLSALVPLRDSLAGRHVVRSPVALHMGFQSAQGRYPGTLMGVIAYERQAFYDARRQGQVLERYRTNPRGMERPAYDARLNALIPVVRGELPVLFAAGNENEIRRALAMGREFNLALTVVGAAEGFRALDALQASRRPVVVSVDFPRPTDVTGWTFRVGQRLPPNDSASADSAARRVIEGNAAALNRAGIVGEIFQAGQALAEFPGRLLGQGGHALADHPDPLDPVCARAHLGEIRDFPFDHGRVAIIRSGHGRQGPGYVRQGPRHQAECFHGRYEPDQAEAGHEPVARLESKSARLGSGEPGLPHQVGDQSHVAVPVADCGSSGVGAESQTKLGHQRAPHHPAGLGLDPLDGGGGFERDETFEGLGARIRRPAPDGHVRLNGEELVRQRPLRRGGRNRRDV
jgi:hypothetical protein